MRLITLILVLSLSPTAVLAQAKLAPAAAEATYPIPAANPSTGEEIPLTKPATRVFEPAGGATEPVGFAAEPAIALVEPPGFLSRPPGSKMEPGGSVTEPCGSLPEPAGFARRSEVLSRNPRVRSRNPRVCRVNSESAHRPLNFRGGFLDRHRAGSGSDGGNPGFQGNSGPGDLARIGEAIGLAFPQARSRIIAWRAPSPPLPMSFCPTAFRSWRACPGSTATIGTCP